MDLIGRLDLLVAILSPQPLQHLNASLVASSVMQPKVVHRVAGLSSTIANKMVLNDLGQI